MVCFTIWKGFLTQYVRTLKSIKCSLKYELLLEPYCNIVTVHLGSQQILTLNSKINETCNYQIENMFTRYPATIPRRCKRLPYDYSSSTIKKFIILTEHVTVCLTGEFTCLNTLLFIYIN